MAAEQAISSQLLDITIDGARGILFNVTGGPDLTLFEVNQAAAIIKETAHPDVNLIFGAVIDQNMKDAVRITVIATGFERTGVPRRIVESARQRAAPDRRIELAPLSRGSRLARQLARQPGFPAPLLQHRRPGYPTFLRNRNQLARRRSPGICCDFLAALGRPARLDSDSCRE